MIAIVDYQMGNLRSVQKGFERVGAEAVVTDDPTEIQAATQVVLPGVGAFADVERESTSAVQYVFPSFRHFCGKGEGQSAGNPCWRVPAMCKSWIPCLPGGKMEGIVTRQDAWRKHERTVSPFP